MTQPRILSSRLGAPAAPPRSETQNLRVSVVKTRKI
jgi:hypothetical protein